MIFQLTITITVDISVDNSNCPYTGQLLKWEKEEVMPPPLVWLEPYIKLRGRHIQMDP